MATSPWAAYWAEARNHPVLEMAARDFAERLVATLPLSSTDVVLDFGCGFGDVALHLAPHVGQVDLWDAAPQALAEAGARASASGRTNVAVVDLAGSDRADLDGRYDVVIVNSVVQYLSLDEVRQWLLRWRRLLAPGGVVLVSDLPAGPPGLAHETVEWLRFCRRHGMLRQGLGHTLREAVRYVSARQARPLLCLPAAELGGLAAAAGLEARLLGANLTCRARRQSLVLSPGTRTP